MSGSRDSHPENSGLTSVVERGVHFVQPKAQKRELNYGLVH